MKVSAVSALLALGLLGACQRSAHSPSAPEPERPPAAPPVSPPPGGSSEAHGTLDAMDTRIPVPLLPMMANHQKQNMRDHLLAVQEIVLALSANDFAAVDRAAGRIGYSQQMAQMCEHMGAGANGFTEQALRFHRTADSIGVAARKRDRAGVLTAVGTTLQMCTGCHATFKQAVVDEATWTRLTAQNAPVGHGR